MAMLHERWESKTKELEKTVSYRTESIALDIALQVFDRLKDLNINRKQLADRLNVSRSYVSQILGGKTNLTLQTLVKIADALDIELHVELKKATPFCSIQFPISFSVREIMMPQPVDASEMYTEQKKPDIVPIPLLTVEDTFCNRPEALAR